MNRLSKCRKISIINESDATFFTNRQIAKMMDILKEIEFKRLNSGDKKSHAVYTLKNKH